MTNDELFVLQANMQSIKRSEEVSDLAGAVSFIASDDAAFITGPDALCQRRNNADNIRLGFHHARRTKCQDSPIMKAWRFFAEVVQMRSFIGAATELRLSKATVSKATSLMERKFGTPLFNRTARCLAVTETGRQFYELAYSRGRRSCRRRREQVVALVQISVGVRADGNKRREQQRQ